MLYYVNGVAHFAELVHRTSRVPQKSSFYLHVLKKTAQCYDHCTKTERDFYYDCYCSTWCNIESNIFLTSNKQVYTLDKQPRTLKTEPLLFNKKTTTLYQRKKGHKDTTEGARLKASLLVTFDAGSRYIFFFFTIRSHDLSLIGTPTTCCLEQLTKTCTNSQ